MGREAAIGKSQCGATAASPSEQPTVITAGDAAEPTVTVTPAGQFEIAANPFLAR